MAAAAAMSTPLKLLLLLFVMLTFGGLIEYVVILHVHSFYGGWEWRAQEQLHSYGANDRLNPRLNQVLGPGNDYRHDLGKEGVLSAQEKLVNMAGGQESILSDHKKVDLSFYDRRDSLLLQMEKTIAHFERVASNSKPVPTVRRDTVRRDFEGDERGFGGGRDFVHYDRIPYANQMIDPEVLVENDSSLVPRALSPFQAAGNNVMLTLRTIKDYHSKRLPLLFSTWLTKVNRSNVFLMTDGLDLVWQNRVWKSGMHYILTSCKDYTVREEVLCCRTGVEMAQIFKPENKHYDWLCHADDDMYVRIPPLIKLLAKFDGKKEAVYLGRSGSEWGVPRKVLPQAKIGTQGMSYHFAVGGMFCLSRAMLELARQYLVGARNFSQTCSQTLEPDDVTVGFVVGVLLNKTLSRTEKIYTHGLHLVSTVDPSTLSEQVAFSYGFGATRWGYDDYNAIYVPGALYSMHEDDSQFKSLHCHLYPSDHQCLKRAHSMSMMV